MTTLFDTGDKYQLTLNLLLFFTYLSLNSALNLTNKWALGVHGFRFPLLLTAFHMGFCFCVLLPVMTQEPYKSKHALTLHSQWKGLVTIGVCMAANISLNNLSLVLITLSLNQVIRSAIPVCTATLAILIEHRIPSHSEAIGLILLSAGVMTTVWEVSASGSMTGVLLCCAGTVCSSAMMSTTGKIMSEKLDVLRLIFYTAPVSCAVLLPLCYIIEVTIRLTVPTGTRFSLYWSEHSTDVVLVLGLSSTVALSYNVVHSVMIQKTSAVTTTVLGEVKIIGLLLLSALLLGEKKAFTLKMMVGVTLAMMGFCIYSHTRLRQQLVPAELSDADVQDLKGHQSSAVYKPLLPVPSQLSAKTSNLA